MRLWRLSSERRARDLSGGYGLYNNGRWNTSGRALTYCSTVPSLTALEKRVHVLDPGLLPPQAMVEYEAPDDLPIQRIEISHLPRGWQTNEVLTQRLGDDWLDREAEALLFVPSVIAPIEAASDRNVLVNHRHKDAARITIAAIAAFTLDPRLFNT